MLPEGVLTGNDHLGMESCGTVCVESGNPVWLLTAEGAYHTLVVPAEIADHIGLRLRVSGTMKAGSLVPDRVEVKAGNSWEDVEIDLT